MKQSYIALLYGIWLYEYTTIYLFNLLWVDICFQILFIMNNAFRNILVPISWCSDALICIEYTSCIESIRS